jgi:hypothetical protein
MASLPAALPDRYLSEQETAGMCLTFLRDHLFFDSDGLTGDAPADTYARFDALAAQVPAGSEGLLFTPWLYGERTPVEDHATGLACYEPNLFAGRVWNTVELVAASQAIPFAHDGAGNASPAGRERASGARICACR